MLTLPKLDTGLVLFMIILVIAAAAVSGAVLLLVRMRRDHNYPGISLLLYQVVFFASFGLYILWGEGFVRHVLLPFGDRPVYDTISRFMGFMGIPFIAAGWFMLLKLTVSVCMVRMNLVTGFLFMLGNMFLVVVLGVFVPDSTRFIFPVFNFTYFFLAGALILFWHRSRLKRENRTSRTLFSVSLVLGGILMSLPLLFISRSFWADVAIIPVWFIGLVLPVASLLRWPELQPAQVNETDRFAHFCQRYEISAREAELILEIMKGKSNKEIADQKFITLQTVKDHIHNIFIKTNVKSRIQLANKVRELE